MLPVSGLLLAVRGPSSDDELMVLETDAPPPLAVIELGRRVARNVDGSDLDWDGLPASDAAAVALTIRQAWMGDLLTTASSCDAAACGERVDVSFHIAAYLEHHRPEVPGGVSSAREPGWFALDGSEARFRIPTVGDLVTALSGPDSPSALMDACIVPSSLSPAEVEQVDAALAALAPTLDGMVEGVCPRCGATLQLRFDPCSYVLAELRDLFAGIYYEIHLLARSHGWSEHDILVMPRSRRIHYAHLAAADKAGV